MNRRIGAFLALALLGVVGVGAVLAISPNVESGPTATPEGELLTVSFPVTQSDQPMSVDILQTAPHDPTAFTQGLVWSEGQFFESTGRDTTLRRTDVASGEQLQFLDLDDERFGEGLALVDDRLILLSYRAEVATVFDAETLATVEEFTYEGEGWGLCYDGQRLVMSNGTATLTFRDPNSFAILGSVEVTRDGDLVTQINELECVNGQVVANVWKSSTIIVIEPSTGEVVGTVDASALVRAADRDDANAVLNGIAFDPVTETFWLTGKLWPTMYNVRIVSRTDPVN